MQWLGECVAVACPDRLPPNFCTDLAEASKVAQSAVPSTVGPSALVSQRSRYLAVGTSTRCSGLSWHGSRSTSVPSVGKCQLHWLVAKSPKMTQIICDGSVMAMPHDENEDARFCHNCGAPLPLPRVPAVAWPSAPVTANALHLIIRSRSARSC